MLIARILIDRLQLWQLNRALTRAERSDARANRLFRAIEERWALHPLPPVSSRHRRALDAYVTVLIGTEAK